MPNTTTNELSLLPFFSECNTWTTPTFHLSHHFDDENKLYQEQEFLFLVSGETFIFCGSICLINSEVFHIGLEDSTFYSMNERSYQSKGNFKDGFKLKLTF